MSIYETEPYTEPKNINLDGYRRWYDESVVRREAWGAEAPKWISRKAPTSRYVMCTYTETLPCFDLESCSYELKLIQERTMRFEDNSDLRLNFLIGGDGMVYEGRGWKSSARVPKRWGRIGRDSIYIAFIGSFRYNSPSEKYFNARDMLLEYGVVMNHICPKFLLFTM